MRVALALDDLPAITEAFAKGDLSYSQVRALTRVAETATEADLLTIARHATAAQLERLVRSYRGVLRREGETLAANLRHDRRYLRYHVDDDSSLVGSFRLDPEEGAVLIKSLEAEVERSAERADEDPVTRTADHPVAARRADALLALVARAHDDEANGDGACRFQVVVHSDASVLAEDAEGRCELADGPALAPETVRRLGCDTSLVAIIDGANGSPLDVGRKTRRIPSRLRKAVLARDGVCVFPGCERPITEIHHRKHWAQGGCTDLANLDGHCKYHHRLVHEGGWSTEHDAEAESPSADPTAPSSKQHRRMSNHPTVASKPETRSAAPPSLPTPVRRTATATRSTSTGSSSASACSASKRSQLPQGLLGVAAVDVAHEGRVDAVAEELAQAW